MSSTVRTWIRASLCVALLGLLSACQQGSGSGGVIIVESQPVSGALVKLGSDTIGTTPCRIEGYPPGITGITLMHPGYQRTSKMIEIPESGEVTVTVQLDELAGYLSVTSRPPHATVYLDDVTELGKTPLQRRAVPLGEHKYSVIVEDYEPASGTLTVEDNMAYVFHHELKPLDARISVVSRPTGARVYVNDRPIEAKTPAKFNLAPGDYTIGVFQDGYVMAEKGIRVGPNEEASVDIQLLQGNVPEGMVLVPAGEFIFGRDNEAPDERPAVRVYLPDYFIDKFEVTNAEFKKVYPAHSFPEKEAFLPVTGVTWRQADDFAKAVGKRLPTEEEWEKAARGPEGLEYPWGNGFAGDRLNFKGIGVIHGPKPVGSYRAGASPYGCLDMAGNVYEWTADWYEPYPGNPVVNATYGQNFRVLRGGSFRSEPYEVRSPRRHYDRPANTRDDYGFRCVKDAPK